MRYEIFSFSLSIWLSLFILLLKELIQLQKL